MSDIKYFNLGQFFSKRALLTTFFGVGLIALTEFVLPWLNILQVSELLNWITPVTITFTFAVILIASAIAKNFAASVFLGGAAILSFFNPYETIDYGFWAVIITYLVLAFFAGFFATVEMTGRTALLIIGIVDGLQGFIGSGTSMFISLTGGYSAFHDNSIGIAYGDMAGNFPLYDVIVAGFSFIFMLVFIIISRKKVSVTHQNKKYEILGQIIIFLGLVGALLVNILAHTTFSNNTAIAIFGEKNTQFLNEIYTKTPNGVFMATTLLNIFYVLPILGFVIAIGLALIIYQRADGTEGFMTLNFEGAFVNLNLIPFLIVGVYSYPLQKLMGSTSYFFLETPTWFSIFTEYTNLLLVNLLIVYIVFLVVTLIRNLSKR
ncbi:MAG: hypothetical protein ACTSSF_05815 [Candidatus Heimdallarchaeaceae archaeon]